ncbi:hypothetical protein PF006_g8498 [Phytophthora fragariae]|uniref:Importin N-terminal domain-containing protein n=1 Tax=Phytophthora fragariae TaxID=53985 RepID=A0A6A3U969_9STRA|nr:hypothetical protein PF009_g9478 [Phytophthora fragariae]KAE9146755.1 hypothetical protein PF006_g8498 [Phytophthora fragariae]
MAQQLAACARQLFEGASGSAEQRAANAWLMQFQAREEAWQAALQLLERPARDPATQQGAPELVAMQILRLKTQQDWTKLSAQQQQVVRQTMLQLLEMTCVGADGGLSLVSCRLACVTLADIVVKSCKLWPSWKSDVQRLMDAGTAAQRQQKGAAVLTEILGAIPLQILMSEKLWTAKEMHEVLAGFQAEGGEVMTAVRMILTSIPEERSSALRCLEGWIVGCVPTHEAFGLTAAHLFSSGLIDALLNIAISGNEEHAQLAAGIAADSFVQTASAPVSENMAAAVLHVGRRLADAMPVFHSVTQSPTGDMMTKDQQTAACRGVSQIACSLAMNHAFVLFSRQVTDIDGASEQHRSFSVHFLELLLACSSYEDIDVVQPTLEIWFFFLEDNSSRNEVSWQLLDVASQEHVISVFSRLVNALIERCKYPQWFVERHQIVSDDPEIEAISDLRREIADTMLSLFSKWPGASGQPSGDYASCVKGISQMLADRKNVALIDALLFLLSYMVELFDVVSSDSESEDDPDSFQAPSTGGMDILLGVLDSAFNLPIHPLVINGIARYLRSLGTSIALPAGVYLRASMIICQGLQFTSSFPVAVQSLLHNSSSITKYTTADERAPLLQELLRFCGNQAIKATQENQGDLLEVTFRVASGLPDADFGALCSSILPALTVGVQSGNPIEASNSVYMLGRALAGVQDQRNGLVGSVLSQRVAPDILTCCSRIISRQRSNQSFQASVDKAFERLLSVFRVKLHAVADPGSDDGKLSMEDFLTHHHGADKLIPEVEQFMKLCREVLISFPQVLLQNRPNGNSTSYWICLELSTRLVKADHQMQEMCDAACDFILEAMRCQPEPILECLNVFAMEVCLHAPQILTQIRGGFQSAVYAVVVEEGALRALFPIDVCQQLPGELRVRRQRHRFRQYFTQLANMVKIENP